MAMIISIDCEMSKELLACARNAHNRYKLALGSSKTEDSHSKKETERKRKQKEQLDELLAQKKHRAELDKLNDGISHVKQNAL